MPETETHEARRLVNADVIRMQHELAMASATRSGEPYVTVELSRNAKGETQISTKVSAPGGSDVAALTELGASVYGEAVTIYERATMRYPTSSGTVTNDPAPKPSAKVAS